MDKDKLIEWIEKKITESTDLLKTVFTREAINGIAGRISAYRNTLNAIQNGEFEPEPCAVEWYEYKSVVGMDGYHRCSACKKQVDKEIDKFCRSCGQPLRKDVDRND